MRFNQSGICSSCFACTKANGTQVMDTKDLKSGARGAVLVAVRFISEIL